jgi:aminopeptidase N
MKSLENRLTVISLAVLCMLSSSPALAHPEQGTAAKGPGPGVPIELATFRASHYSNLEYDIKFKLAPGAAFMEGAEEIRVSLDNPSDDLILDWRVQSVEAETQSNFRSLEVNGKAVTGARHVNDHIIIPAGYLRTGGNGIRVAFQAPVSTSGSAVTRYLDREDGSEYVYTLFVPSDASSTFPCFDQPDLKARFKLNLSVASGWTAVSNTMPEGVSDASGTGLREWRFAQTERISTYLFAFAAGPFAQLSDASSSLHTRMFVRHSRLERAKKEAAEVFRITREGLDYYINYFAFRYPFPKYDLVVIPEFAYGGMEHAGATFLNEDGIIFPTEPTANNFLSRAQLILHETAHQWFGDLVTMRWFDDLWLKEGFATFMATKASETVMPQYAAWKAFYLHTKPAAYVTDGTKGTTPIWQEIPNLSAAKSAYGNIVYNKAPSMLHQAEFYLGSGKFQAAIQMFVRAHAYSNARWGDLVADFERASGQKLDQWADAWVKHRGMPAVHVDWAVDARGNLSRLTLSQSDVLDEGGVWPMRLKVLLAYDQSKPVVLTIVLNSKSLEVAEAVGMPAPVYVFANYEDYGYGRFLLDAKSRPAVIQRLGAVKDDFLRALLWGSLWDSVRETELAPSDYLGLGIKLVADEPDEVAAQSILGHQGTAFARLLSVKQQQQIGPALEQLLYGQMMGSPAKGLRITYFQAFRSIATTEDGRKKLKELFSGAAMIPDVPLRSLDRFDIVTHLLSEGDKDGPEMLAAATKADSSDNGRRYSYAAAAARADAGTKKQYFDTYVTNHEIPESWVAASLGPFNSIEQADLTFPYLAPALTALPQMKRTRKIFFVNGWLGTFIGGQCSQGARDVVENFLGRQQVDKDLRLKILEAKDGLDRCVRIRAKYALE